MKIWEVKIATRNDVACKELFSYMVRGTDLDRRRNWQSARAAFFEDPEARLMDIKAEFHRGDKNLVVVFVACSDGFTRFFLYDVSSNVLHASSFVNYCDRCVLRVNNYQFGDESIFMTMSTDGIVRFWRINEAVEDLIERKKSCGNLKINVDAKNRPFSLIRIHQSGINYFDFRKIDDCRFLLLTGGNDNLISLVLIEISMRDNQISVSKVSSWNSSSIHSAQITGAKFMDENRILTTGIDQLVVTFQYSYSNGRLTVSRAEETTTLVSDVQGVALNKTIFKNDDILACVYGKGIKIMVVNR